MKKFVSKCAFFVLFMSGIFGLFQPFSQAQIANTQGRDFWFSFMNNNGTTPTQTCLILSATRACSATVSNPNTGWSTTVSIPAGGRVDVDIPIAQGYFGNSDYGTVNTGCHVVSTDTISAYTMNYRHASFDGSLLFPTSTLGSDYVIQTFTTNLNGSALLIIATENNTLVDITPSVATTDGHAAGSTYTISLNAGQVYETNTSASSDAAGDFSGTVITAQNCKKIAVFAGHKCANIPSGCTYCDHIYETMVPTAYWGTRFIPTVSYARSKDEVRVTVLNDNTTVRKNGVVVATLAAGASYTYELTSSENSCYIETSGPAVAYLYLVGQNCGGTSGDPSMLLLSPVEQGIKRVAFGTYQSSDATYSHYVNIVTRTDNVSSVQLDGASISGQFNTVAGNPDYSYARVNVSHATHVLQSDSGVVAHVYGLAEVTSYAYSVGTSAVNLNAQMFVNQVNTADIPDGYDYCSNRDIDFELQLNFAYTQVYWDFGDGETGEGNPTSHRYMNEGRYNVIAVVERVGSNCFDDFYDTLYTTVIIPSLESIPIYRSMCVGGSYMFNGNELTEPGIYTDTLETGSDCDSIIELHLSFVPTDPVPVNKTICPGESLWFMGEAYSTPGTYTIQSATDSGCDSIIELHLNYGVVPSVNLGNDKVLCTSDELPVRLAPSVSGMAASYAWSTGATSSTIDANQPGLYSVTVTNNAGCIGSDEMEIRIQDELSLDIEQTNEYCDDGFAHFIVHTNAPNVYWSTGDYTPEVDIHGYGRYYVRVYDGPCEMNDYVEIPQCPFDLYFPTCITPSFADGQNDNFQMWDADIVTEFEIWIYDRWGFLVFHSTDPHFSWDGTHNGKVCANNVFSWRAFAKPKTENKKYEFHGSVLVL
ncbi:MAG: gliding motility-associated C-terminal domain-containing protein [Bacteroidales bacterium]|nr:gliding motility-associated C-terminal domain-containing protein [Bacteroidales bacterium]